MFVQIRIVPIDGPNKYFLYKVNVADFILNLNKAKFCKNSFYLIGTLVLEIVGTFFVRNILVCQKF